MKDRLPIIIRIIGLVGGMFGGGIIGGLLLTFAIMVSGTNLGLSSIWPGVQVGAVIGGLIGLIFPRIGMKLAELFSSFTL